MEKSKLFSHSPKTKYLSFRSKGAEVIIYEPTLVDGTTFFGSKVVNEGYIWKGLSFGIPKKYSTFVKNKIHVYLWV